MSAETTNTATLIIWLFPWALWLVWELVVLWQRRPGSQTKPRTISMVARNYGHRLTVVVYLWAAMASHWWWPAAHFAPVWMGITFWAIPLALLFWDIGLWMKPLSEWPPWLWVVRNPLVWLGVGFLAGRFLFPQA